MVCHFLSSPVIEAVALGCAIPPFDKMEHRKRIKKGFIWYSWFEFIGECDGAISKFRHSFHHYNQPASREDFRGCKME